MGRITRSASILTPSVKKEAPSANVVYVDRIVEVVKEVEVEKVVTRDVERVVEVVKEVPVEVIKEVKVYEHSVTEVPVDRIVEVIKEVPVEKVVEVKVPFVVHETHKVFETPLLVKVVLIAQAAIIVGLTIIHWSI
jgi:hypothetical protein